MKVNDSGSIFVNQGWRPAICLGVVGDRALVQYTMPGGMRVMLEVGADLPLKGRSTWHERDHHGCFQPMPGYRTARNIPAKRVPFRWKYAAHGFSMDHDGHVEHARRVLEYVANIDDDSFCITNAVRALPNYDDLTYQDRAAINRIAAEL